MTTFIKETAKGALGCLPTEWDVAIANRFQSALAAVEGSPTPSEWLETMEKRAVCVINKKPYWIELASVAKQLGTPKTLICSYYNWFGPRLWLQAMLLPEMKAKYPVQLLDPSLLKLVVGTKSNITEEQISRIIQFLYQNPAHLTDLHRSEDIARRVASYPDGSHWIHLNKDVVVGKGAHKKAVNTLNVQTGKLALRTTEKCFNDRDRALKLNELNAIKLLHKYKVPGIIKIYHSRFFQSKHKQDEKPITKFERIQEFCSGGNLSNYLDTQDRSVAINPIRFANKLLDIFIGATKIGLTIGDLNELNVLIDQHGDPVISDWGGVIKFDPNHIEQTSTILHLGNIFSNLFCRYPELLPHVLSLILRMQDQNNPPTLEECRKLLNIIAKERCL